MADYDNTFDLEKAVQAANNFVGRKMEINHY
jgi:hypothetical protein